MSRLALIFLLLAAPLRAAAPDAEQLAGEKEEAKQPQARPTASEAEQGAAVSLTRGAKAPAFELPEFVVTGSGARKALGERPDLNTWMDTSGGIKTSPGEEDASKNQLGAQGSRERMEALTESARPAYGQLRAVYGLANSFDGQAFFGQELGDFYYLLEADGAFSDGGPLPPGHPAINQSGRGGVKALGGWRLKEGRQLSGQAFARRRTRLWTKLPLPAPRMEREWQGGSLDWEGSPSDRVRHSFHAGVDRSQAILPAQGTVYVESLISLRAAAESWIESRRSRTQLKGELYVSDLCQDNGARVPLLAGGWAMAAFKPWKGASLGLGISVDSVSGGGLSALLVAPRAEVEQRFGKGISAWASFAPGLALPSFAGPDGLFDRDPAIPSRATRPSVDRFNVQAGLGLALPANIGLEIKGHARQNEDAFQLDDPAAAGLWTTYNLRGMRRLGVEASESGPLGGGFSQKLSAGWESVELVDSPGLLPTFAPALKGVAALGWEGGRLRAELRLDYTGAREARSLGGMSLPAYAGLGASAEYEINGRFSVLAEASNLLSQEAAEFPGYPEAAPFAGLGLKAQF